MIKNIYLKKLEEEQHIKSSQRKDGKNKIKIMDINELGKNFHSNKFLIGL